MKNNTLVSVSAPGKLVLMGEHAVMYGSPLIVTAVDRRLTVNVEDSEISGVTIDTGGVADTRFVSKALEVAKNHWGKSPNIKITTKSQFSSLYGFGSSSASVVATLFAMREFLEKKDDRKKIFEMAYETVLGVQKKGSGFDVASAVFGGTIMYGSQGAVLDPLDVDPPPPLVVGYTGIKADTTSLIQMVEQKKNAFPQKVDRIFEAIAKLVVDGKNKMTEGDWERVGKLMEFNQEYLRDLGVSSEKLEALIHAAKSAGAWGAKLSGAGGGDCMIALSPEDKREAVIAAIRDSKGEVVDVLCGAEGVRLETTDDQSEMFIVVDTSDNVLGYKSRYECHHDKSLIHRTVGALIYNDKGEILLQKRAMTKDMERGLWGISCAGHVTQGQTDDEAIHRELEEELGIDTALSFLGKFIVENQNETERAALYGGVHNGPFKSEPKEISEIRFVSPGEIRQKINSGEMVFTGAAISSLRLAGVLV
jgi:mevalonate kinase